MDGASQMTYKPDLDDFYTHTYEVRHEPTQNISTDGFRSQWEFIINQNDLAKHIRPHLVDIQITLQAVDNDGVSVFKSHTEGDFTAVTNGDRTAMINNSLYSYFSNMKLFLNNDLVSDTYGLNHFQCYLYSLLSVSHSAMSSISNVWGMYDDSNMCTTSGSLNSGLKSRNLMLKNGNKFILRGPLMCPLFQQNTPIISSNIRLELERNSFERMIFM